MAGDPASMIVIGRLVRAHGIRGEVLVRGEPDELALLAERERVHLRRQESADSIEIVELIATRPHRGGLLVTLPGVVDRNAAEALVGATIEVPEEDLPEPTTDGHLWPQLRGYRVVTEEGVDLGRIDDRVRTGANDVLIVRDGEMEHLIPATDEVLREVDPEGKTLIIHVLPGLLEINDKAHGESDA